MRCYRTEFEENFRKEMEKKLEEEITKKLEKMNEVKEMIKNGNGNHFYTLDMEDVNDYRGDRAYFIHVSKDLKDELFKNYFYVHDCDNKYGDEFDKLFKYETDVEGVIRSEWDDYHLNTVDKFLKIMEEHGYVDIEKYIWKMN